jgi:hypothetical protein
VERCSSNYRKTYYSSSIPGTIHGSCQFVTHNGIRTQDLLANCSVQLSLSRQVHCSSNVGIRNKELLAEKVSCLSFFGIF